MPVIAAKNYFWAIAAGIMFFAAETTECKKSYDTVMRQLGNAAADCLNIYRGSSRFLKFTFIGWRHPACHMAKLKLGFLIRMMQKRRLDKYKTNLLAPGEGIVSDECKHAFRLALRGRNWNVDGEDDDLSTCPSAWLDSPLPRSSEGFGAPSGRPPGEC